MRARHKQPSCSFADNSEVVDEHFTRVAEDLTLLCKIQFEGHRKRELYSIVLRRTIGKRLQRACI